MGKAQVSDAPVVKVGKRIMFPGWDGTPGPTLTIKYVGDDYIITLSANGASVIYPLRNVQRMAKAVR